MCLGHFHAYFLLKLLPCHETHDKLLTQANMWVVDLCVPVNMIIKNLHDWNVLQRNQEKIRCMTAGVRQVEQVAREIFRATHGWRIGVPRLVTP